jgi:hypothetical protein
VSEANIEFLKEELVGLALAAKHLEYSLERCAELIGQSDLPPEKLERLESLTSRFARLADLLIQRIFRLVDEIELVSAGTVRDRIERAEMRGWANASQLVKIRELRNMIAHEYAAEKMVEIYSVVYALANELLAIVPRVSKDAHVLINKYSR